MKGETWIFGLCSIFFVLVAPAYWFITGDHTGTTALVMTFLLTTLIAFFLAEIGDKTQIATVMLAAQYPELWLVIIGTTVGMLIANVPVVLAGNFAAEKLPLTLIRLQRREFYRMNTPVTNPVRVVVPLPDELGGPTSFPLADISCGGIAILDNKMILGDAIGKEYPNCRIDLPEIGQVTTALQVRNSLDLTLLNNKTNRRLGCEFVNIQRSTLSYVQRYITKLERERNARIAGMM